MAKTAYYESWWKDSLYWYRCGLTDNGVTDDELYWFKLKLPMQWRGAAWMRRK